jgi:hypothetical protein
VWSRCVRGACRLYYFAKSWLTSSTSFSSRALDFAGRSAFLAFCLCSWKACCGSRHSLPLRFSAFYDVEDENNEGMGEDQACAVHHIRRVPRVCGVSVFPLMRFLCCFLSTAGFFLDGLVKIGCHCTWYHTRLNLHE